MEKIKIQGTKEMIDEINDVRKKCGFEPTKEAPHELEAYLG